ncbi:hypothetical protein BWQ96_00165 [Gracilariopsis chorda]|uniref:Uncharacterized protein n=1 Tax=Gracilariopsis chorda TaxID=448386 RepID=A0A2V3J6H1_9FLOR|nr:hypothetical protein BWQ96_00165 [Gracilariopsis chorda]|eukprot:PXF50005.1 hypothetical protein BWQ96_00165 [Gracilariopsis chorda]
MINAIRMRGLRRFIFSSFTPGIVLIALATLTQSQLVEVPPPDPPPDIQTGYSAFALSISFISSLLGFAPEVVQGMKAILSQNLGIPLEHWVYSSGRVVDATTSLFAVTLDVIVPMEEIKHGESLTRKFISSGQLDEEFATIGLSGMMFTLTDQEIVEEGTPTPKVPKSDLSELVDALPPLHEGEELSRLLDLYVVSPTIYFTPVLKEAIRWFAGNETNTLTDPSSWYLPELTVLNSTRGQYIATLVHVGNIGEADMVLNQSAAYVAHGGLTQALLESGARDVNITLLPRVKLAKPEEDPSIDSDLISVDILFRMSAPISGITNEVVEIMKARCADITETQQAAWRLKYVAPEVEENVNGPFITDLGVIVPKTQKVETVRLVAGLVRSRALDHGLWEGGHTDVRVRLRPRLTPFKSNGSGGNAIQSTAATVAASIAGMLIVVCIGAGILCLLPREGNFGPVRSFLAEVDKSGKVWPFRR